MKPQKRNIYNTQRYKHIAIKHKKLPTKIQTNNNKTQTKQKQTKIVQKNKQNKTTSF